MKNVFDIYYDKNFTSVEEPASDFKMCEVPDELAEKYGDAAAEAELSLYRAGLPFWVQILSYIGFIAGLIMLAYFIIGVSETDFAAAFAERGWSIIAGAIILVFAVAVYVLNAFFVKRAKQSPAYSAVQTEEEKLKQRCFDELRVPENAEAIDVFAGFYSVKNGKVKGATSVTLHNYEMRVFKDGERLYLANTECVYGFPLRNFTQTVRMDKNLTFDKWNKSEDFKHGGYRSFKISRIKSAYRVKGYISARFISSGEEYEIIIPAYEAETLAKYLNL